MITIKAFVPTSQRRADGTYNVKIRVTLKRRSRWISTNVFVTDADLTRAKKLKNPYIIAQCDALVKEFRGIVSELSPFAVEAMDVDGVLSYIRKQKEEAAFHLDFLAFGREIAAGQTPGTAGNTRTALNAFARFLGRDSIDVNEITAAQVRAFVDYMDAEPKQTSIARHRQKQAAKTGRKKAKGVSSWKYTSILRSIYKRAREKYNDEDSGVIRIPRSPFDSVRFKEGVHVGQRNLGIDILQRMIDDKTEDRSQRFALDVFLLSFCLMGINIADLFEASLPVDGVLEYERVKTRERRRDRALMRTTVPAQAADYVQRLRDVTGRRWLRLWQEGDTPSKVGYKVNYGLTKWAAAHGVPRFTYYAARHSWGSIAGSAECGIDKATVNECLNHAGDKLADIYIDKDFRVYDAANAKVLAPFQFPGGNDGN